MCIRVRLWLFLTLHWVALNTAMGIIYTKQDSVNWIFDYEMCVTISQRAETICSSWKTVELTLKWNKTTAKKAKQNHVPITIFRLIWNLHIPKKISCWTKNEDLFWYNFQRKLSFFLLILSQTKSHLITKVPKTNTFNQFMLTKKKCSLYLLYQTFAISLLYLKKSCDLWIIKIVPLGFYQIF